MEDVEKKDVQQDVVILRCFVCDWAWLIGGGDLTILRNPWKCLFWDLLGRGRTILPSTTATDHFIGDSSDVYPENWGWVTVFKKFRCFSFIHELSLSLSRQPFGDVNVLNILDSSPAWRLHMWIPLEFPISTTTWNTHGQESKRPVTHRACLCLLQRLEGWLWGWCLVTTFSICFLLNKWGSNMGLNLKKFRYQ